MDNNRVNDRFIELMLEREPILYKKVWDGGFMVIQLNTGELKIFIQGKDILSEEMDRIMPVFRQAVWEESER